MANIELIRRISKGSPLSWPEVDGNWRKISDGFKGLAIAGHEELTTSHIGKLLILKDGVAKLPEFVFSEAPYTAASIEYTGSFTPFERPRLTIVFTENLIEGDFVEITLRSELNTPRNVTFTAVEADDNETEFLIDGSEFSTALNFITKLQAWMTANNIHACYTAIPGPSSNIIYITASVIEFERETNFWEDTSSSNTYISITREGDLLADRVKDSMLGALFLSCIRCDVNGSPITPIDFYHALSAISNEGENTDEVYQGTTLSPLIKLPANATELLASVASAVTFLFLGVSLAEVDGTDLLMTLAQDTSNFRLVFQSSEDESFFEDNFSELTLEEVPGSGNLYCPYPIIGLLRGFTEDGLALICNDKICKVTLGGEDPIDMNTLLPLVSVGRICVLDPASPGDVKVQTITSTESLVGLAPGYVYAMEAVTPGNEFWAQLVLDTSFLAIIFSLGE
jgi:hypothetical protein